MVDLPRNWQYFEVAFGTAPSIVLPAIANVSHTLTSIVGQVLNETAATIAPTITVLFGAATVWQGVINTPASDEGDLTWSGALTAPPDTAVTIQFDAGGGSINEYLTVQGYDF